MIFFFSCKFASLTILVLQDFCWYIKLGERWYHTIRTGILAILKSLLLMNTCQCCNFWFFYSVFYRFFLDVRFVGRHYHSLLCILRETRCKNRDVLKGQIGLFPWANWIIFFFKIWSPQSERIWLNKFLFPRHVQDITSSFFFFFFFFSLSSSIEAHDQAYFEALRWPPSYTRHTKRLLLTSELLAWNPSRRRLAVALETAIQTDAHNTVFGP